MRRFIPLCLCLGACSSAPPSAPARNGTLERAEVEFLGGHYRTAAHQYEEALSAAPAARRAEILAQIGKCRLGAGDPEGALRAFGDALAESPSPALRLEIHYRRAAAYNARWQPAEALADLSRVREAPAALRATVVRSEEFAYRYAVTTLRAGDWRGGRALLGGVVARFPDSREALDAKDRLALGEFRVQIARLRDAAAAGSAAQARLRDPKPGPGEAVASAAGDYLVLVGRFPRFADAVREMERLRRSGHPDAFIVP